MDHRNSMELEAPRILFEAEIPPYRSLSRRGITIVVSVLAVLSLAVTTVAWLIGAWPVAGFSGLEIGAVLVMLRWNARGAESLEILVLTEDSLSIHRADRRGRPSRITLPSAWLNAVLEEPPGQVPSLLLVNRRSRVEVAKGLGEVEKRDLAAALKAALHRLRSPTFDNPQLREG
jgi:uncharacterized membrane protein